MQVQNAISAFVQGLVHSEFKGYLIGDHLMGEWHWIVDNLRIVSDSWWAYNEIGELLYAFGLFAGLELESRSGWEGDGAELD